MALRRYKTWGDSRQDLVDLCIAESSASSSRHAPLEGVPVWKNASRHKVKGVFRFKSWEEAQRFDLELLIEEACSSEVRHES